MYYMISMDQSILLTNDKKSIVISSWEEVQKMLANAGKFIGCLKKLRESIENDQVANAHLGHIIAYSESLNSSPNSEQDPSLQNLTIFLLNAIALSKFVKILKGVSLDQLKTPSRLKASFKSPDRPKTAKNFNSASTNPNRLLSPANGSSMNAP